MYCNNIFILFVKSRLGMQKRQWTLSPYRQHHKVLSDAFMTITAFLFISSVRLNGNLLWLLWACLCVRSVIEGKRQRHKSMSGIWLTAGLTDRRGRRLVLYTLEWQNRCKSQDNWRTSLLLHFSRFTDWSNVLQRVFCPSKSYMTVGGQIWHWVHYLWEV